MESRYQFVLASSSPRRQELIKGCFLNFEVVVSEIDENVSGMSPKDLVQFLALEKAKAVLGTYKEQEHVLILGADTIVVIDNMILGKPKNREDAKRILKILSGREHEVMTGVALVSRNCERYFVETTKVTFEEIDDDLIDFYLDTGESMDKAGAYGIQGVALSFINKVEGSYSNVVGLPVNRVLQEVKHFVGASDDKKGKWRELFL